MSNLLASVSDSLKIWSWDVNQRELNLHSNYRSNSEHYYGVSWNHTNQVLAIGGKEPKIHLVQASTGQLLSSLILSESKLSVKVQAVCFSHNSRYLATSVGMPIQLWDLKKRQIKSIFTGHRDTVVSVNFLPSGDFYAADESGCINLWSTKSSSPLQTLTEDLSDAGAKSAKSFLNTLTSMQLSPISSILAAGYSDGTMRVWDTANGGSVLRKQRSHSERITAIACSTKNPRLVATVGMDGFLNLTDIGMKNEEFSNSINLQQPLTAISLHEDNLHSAVGTVDGQILVYDWRNVKDPLCVIGAHEPYPINALCFQVRNLEALSHSPIFNRK